MIQLHWSFWLLREAPLKVTEIHESESSSDSASLELPDCSRKLLCPELPGAIKKLHWSWTLELQGSFLVAELELLLMLLVIATSPELLRSFLIALSKSDHWIVSSFQWLLSKSIYEIRKPWLSQSHHCIQKVLAFLIYGIVDFILNL